MCKCQSEIDDKLLTRFKEQHPEAREHSARLTGYALVLSENGVLSIPCMPFEASALYPLKKGGEKPKTVKSNMMFSFCPFCGEKFDKGSRTTASTP